jgi:hypothetical protein
MALTLTEKSRVSLGNKFLVCYEVTGDGSTTQVNASSLGLKHIEHAFAVNEDNIGSTESRVEMVRMASIAAGTADEMGAFYAPTACTISAVYIIPDDAITGADTNYMTLKAVNKGSDGTGIDVICSKDFTLGVNAAQFDATSLGTVSNNALSAGDTVTFAKAEAGTGMAMPNLAVALVYVQTGQRLDPYLGTSYSGTSVTFDSALSNGKKALLITIGY